MSGRVEYETGARKLKPAPAGGPRDAVSQDAAENRKPPLGTGLTERVGGRRSEIENADRRRPDTGEGSRSGQRG